MNFVYVFVLCFISAFAGAFFTSRWYRGDVNHYKELYVKVAAEKESLMTEYGRRLDELKRLVGSNSVVVNNWSGDSFSGDMEPLGTSDGTSDNLDEYF